MTQALRQAAQEILRATEDIQTLTPREWHAVHDDKVEALRAALAEPAEQEPVGEVRWAADVPGTVKEVRWANYVSPPVGTKLYTAPQPAKREPLTDKQWQKVSRKAREAFFDCNRGNVLSQIDCAAHAAMRTTEDAHGIGGQT